MPFPKTPNEEKTDEAFNNPRVGDRFSETYSFYVYVLEVKKNTIVTLEAHPPCALPEEGKVLIQTPEQFRERFAYGSMLGYSVTLVDRDNAVKGWLEAAAEKKNITHPPGMGSWSVEAIALENL